MIGGGAADDGERAALALADRAKRCEVGWRDREHVTLLRLVAPDFARRHAGFLGRDRAKLDRAANAAAVDQLGQRVRQSTRPDVVDRQYRIALAELPAAVDHFLRAPPPMPISIPGPPSWISSAPSMSGRLCVCAALMLPTPPASMIGL